MTRPSGQGSNLNFFSNPCVCVVCTIGRHTTESPPLDRQKKIVQNKYSKRELILKTFVSPSTTLDVVGIGVAVTDGAQQITLALAPISVPSRRALRNIKVVDLSGGNVVDEA